MSFFTELKRRNVFRMGIAYVVVAWVLLQAIDFALDLISAPNWVLQVFFIAALVGLPIVLIVSWVFEMTPEGIKLESEIDRSESVTHSTGHKLDRTIITFLAFAVVLLLAERFIMTESVPVSATATEVVAEQPGVAGQAADNTVRSVAVLPFVNMSSDPEQEYFSDGLSEELLNRLAQNDNLRVAARTSSFQFKGQNQDIGEIGRQLKVDHILEGSVRKSSNRLRITVQLIQVDSGYHLWSETYEREMDDVFAIQDDISLAISRALDIELGTATPVGKRKPTENLEAYQLYLQARYFLAKRGGDNILKSLELFKQATELDDKFSEAWSGMAYAYGLATSYTRKISASQASDLALESARKAIRIDPENAEAYMALARTQGQTDRNNVDALENFEKALLLAPNNVDIINMYGDFLINNGNFDKALEIEMRAIELDPLAAVHYSDLAFLMLLLQQNDDALEVAQTSARLAPDSYDRHDPLIVALIRLGKYEQAIEIINMAEDKLAADPGNVNYWWCMLYYNQGDRENLRKQLSKRLEAASRTDNYYPTSITAFFTLWLDGVEAALPLLEKSYEEKEVFLAWPEFFYLPEDVSDDPAWTAFWQKPGLAELMETRRANGPYENIGYWKAPTP
ncbi:MAG: tetratricopeptide repeat protein [Xanthomonadales bacterium]|nr:tetratricopeptide repeat protein [Xanthomonadales bacterium]